LADGEKAVCPYPIEAELSSARQIRQDINESSLLALGGRPGAHQFQRCPVAVSDLLNVGIRLAVFGTVALDNNCLPDGLREIAAVHARSPEPGRRIGFELPQLAIALSLYVGKRYVD